MTTDTFDCYSSSILLTLALYTMHIFSRMTKCLLIFFMNKASKAY